ncbi:MAG: hypothetical protein QM809_18560 [Gordonia sp. (in: high G+C Gram-positive bacteria)]|uniref:hypothetical protein n=1 Tax=Gordonia sp. (in: high G+C Gram-positive bacteria) TaxID=84139 RepID=UPI0039E2CB96
MPAAPPTIPRLRAAVVGATTAVTGVAAHAQGHGALPDGNVLVLLGAAGIAVAVVLGDRDARRTTPRRAPSSQPIPPVWRLLPALAGGQIVVHLLLIALAGHPHAPITAPMAVTHTVGTLAALALVAAVESLVRTVAGLALRIVALLTDPPVAGPAVPPTPPAPFLPARSLRHLGTVGTRGPPLVLV